MLKALDLEIPSLTFLPTPNFFLNGGDGGHEAKKSKVYSQGRLVSNLEAAALPLYRQTASPREACAPREEPRGGALESQRLGEFSHANSSQRQLQAGELERSHFHRSIDPSVAS